MGCVLCVISFSPSKNKRGKKCITLSLFSVHRRAHIQTALLNRFLANTSCVDRRDELLFLLQLAEGTEPGPRSKRAATVEATKPADLLLLPLPTHTNTHTLSDALLYQRHPGGCLTIWTGDSHLHLLTLLASCLLGSRTVRRVNHTLLFVARLFNYLK